MEKTELGKILAVSGQSGLFRFIAQARNGVIAESLVDKKRNCFGLSTKITSLEDISIYTSEGEKKLREVFLAIKKALGTADAPNSKSAPEALKELFAKAVPDYDGDRFYVSHMKKVVDWYNCLKNYASLDFVNPEEEAKAAEDEDTAKNAPVKAATPAAKKTAAKKTTAAKSTAKAAPKAAPVKKTATVRKSGGK